MSRLLMSAAVVAALSGSALAAPVVEVEANNTLGTANTLTPAQQAAFVAANAFVFDGTITTGVAAAAGAVGIPADVDFVRFTVPFDAYIVASTFGIPNSSIGDSMIVLYRDLGGGNYQAIVGNDDDGLGAFSAIEAQIVAGTYLIGISMYPDVSIGAGGSVTGAQDGLNANGAPIVDTSFNYKLNVGINEIPTPGAAAVLGLAGLAAARRRRA